LLCPAIASHLYEQDNDEEEEKESEKLGDLTNMAAVRKSLRSDKPNHKSAEAVRYV
jgi:hypothetical protein